jgi:DNA gyrase/topoisomerase IV subunit A
MGNLNPIIKDSFKQFAGAVLQSRALGDVRDCIKPSARQIFYCLYTDGFVSTKPFQKTLKAIGSAFRLYIHGDSSCEGVIMRAGQPFAMRYPLIEVGGSYGTLLAPESWSAPRYTEARLSPIADYLFKDLKKDTIAEWRDNYDNTEKYPSVLPSKGFFNLVNGLYGIGVGASSSIPSYNLKELNTALIKVLWNPDIDFEDIYCIPDFPTGGTIINPSQVKESHRKGNGFACKIRSTISWDETERTLVVTEIPYMIYTETICKELENIINGDENPGIDRFNDLTGKTPLIKIYLTKSANYLNVLKYLYKNTSLQSYYGINLTMLDNGRFPKIFTWKEILQSYIKYQIEVYTRSFNFDLNKTKNRLDIINGLLKAISILDSVISTIKKSSSSTEASKNLCLEYGFSGAQAKAILDIKLSRLTHLDISKLEKEKSELEKEKERIELILSDNNLLKKEIEKDLTEVMNRFGDERRTKVIELDEDKEEEVEKKQISISFTNHNYAFSSETSTLFTQKKGSNGKKFKLESGEYIIDNFVCNTTDNVLVFTKDGKYFSINARDFTIDEKMAVKTDSSIKAAVAFSKESYKKYIVFITKNGLIKKTELSEYNTNRKGKFNAINIEDNDELVSVMECDNEKISILTKSNFLIIDSDKINPTGKNSKGVKGIGLSAGDYVIKARAINKNDDYVLFIANNGDGKKVSIKDFNINERGSKGVKVQKDETNCDEISFNDSDKLLVTSLHYQLKIDPRDLILLSRNANGSCLMKLKPDDLIISLSKI